MTANRKDAIQVHSAVRVQAACLISRNPGDFPADSLPVLSPTVFLATLAPEEA